MKQIIITIFLTIFFISINVSLTSISLAGNVYTADEIETLLKKQCGAVVVLVDMVYEEYSFGRVLTKVDCTNYKYKPNLFDCDDIAFAVKALVIEHISQITDSGGAVMFGVAFVFETAEKSGGHVVNIAIYKKAVFIYDWQKPVDENVVTLEKYLKTHTISIIII